MKMSGKFYFKGKTVERNNDRASRNISVLRKTNSLLPTTVVCAKLKYDVKDFPSLPESFENSSQHKSSDIKNLNFSDKVSSENSPHLAFCEPKTVSYSDKLKVPFKNQNVNFVSASGENNHFKKLDTDKVSRETCSSGNNKYIKSQETQLKSPRIKGKTAYSENNHGRISNKTYSSIFNNKETQQEILRMKDETVPVKNNHGKIKNEPHSSLMNDKETQRKLYSPRPKILNKDSDSRFYNRQTNFDSQTSKQNDRLNKELTSQSSAGINNKSSKSHANQMPNNSIKCTIMFDQVIEKTDDVPNKKKKRKSKIKRTASLQTGKITVLTPEVHSKILNQESSSNTVNVKCVVTDINNEEEYPELGTCFVPSSQIRKEQKKENQSVEEKKINEVPICEPEVIQKEPSSDNKPVLPEKKVHIKDPITVSFLEMLMAKSSKVNPKELQEATSTDNSSLIRKSKPKKALSQAAPNLLDSSCPVIKRGKERENPKPKKPSPLKKIILLDRKFRKENLLKPESSYEETENTAEKCGDSLLEMETIVEESTNPESSDTSASFEHTSSEVPSFSSNPEISSLNLVSDSQDKDLKNVPNEVLGNQDQDSLETNESVLSVEKHSNDLESIDSLLNSLSKAPIASGEINEKEKAAKVLLHTRNFREYCNHLISKDIDDAVHALLDDLARFQDRSYQKDPVKARMKRRMIYGINEVKKYIKLKKVKCIIIAPDLENVQMEGGLNDAINDIKLLAEHHSIPCVFALSRRPLGKVCHKPVPVSCIGIFNADGSEANFKKIAELLVHSKKDYGVVLRNLMEKITEEEVVILLKARKEPETLQEIRTTILRRHFLPSQNDDVKEENTTNTD